jgi:uncharacterized OB-fold protein
VSAGPAPAVDRDSRPWWDALARHELVLQRCSACRAWRWPPRAICNRCASFEWEWVVPSGRGSVASWIVNHHRFSEAFESPYPVVTVRLEDQADLLLPGSFTGPMDRLRIGLGVVADFDDAVDEAGRRFTLLTWRPEDGADWRRPGDRAAEEAAT